MGTCFLTSVQGSLFLQLMPGGASGGRRDRTPEEETRGPGHTAPAPAPRVCLPFPGRVLDRPRPSHLTLAATPATCGYWGQRGQRCCPSVMWTLIGWCWWRVHWRPDGAQSTDQGCRGERHLRPGGGTAAGLVRKPAPEKRGGGRTLGQTPAQTSPSHLPSKEPRSE